VEDKSTVAASGEEMRSLDCGSFRIASVVDRRGGGERQQPMALVVLAPGLPLPAWLSIGMEAVALRARLGVPTRERPTNLSYRVDPSRPGGDSITFELEAGRLRAVAWNWRVD
jgi:hypothetical protein